MKQRDFLSMSAVVLRKISSNLTPIVKQLVTTKKFRSYTHKDVANCLRETGIVDVSESTICRTLKKLEIRKTRLIKDVLTDFHKKTRLNWCVRHQLALWVRPWYFDDWLISDEFRVSLNGKGVLQENKSAIFQQDGASIHTSKLNREFFDRFGISPPFWPPKSPDLSVIENVWGSIKFELAKNTSIKTVQDIARAVPELWNKLVTRKFCEALWENIPDCIAAVIANKGARIKY
ncbi:hypothetical protein BV898_01191 [Hypsibius exemplaris]|uniref:Tc1-like transposase DDE domain-containing protein n=1 Tax=Hypsibius exemplaris TaxID=2072580 RepID=A0A1W0XCC2_HYPEX|nr:hypothetical protein BV898_01191 [Hypsibius exemplaris]